MVQIFRTKDSVNAIRAGYGARYVADLIFRKSIDSCGVIFVDIEKNGKSTPHSHEHLEEAFIAMTDIRIFIDDTQYDLEEGDVVIAAPGEAHSFETMPNRSGRILALKFPNVKEDKVVPVSGSEN